MSIPREHRLRKHSEFELVYRNGRRHFSPLLTAFYLLRKAADAKPEMASSAEEKSEKAGGSRVGITVGRAMGTSVARNRIKRRVRAAVTQNLKKITRPIDVVINPKKTVRDIEFAALCSEVARAFDVIEQKAVSSTEDEGERHRKRPDRLAAKKT